MLPILNIGPIAIQFPGLLILLGIWVGISLMEKQAPQRNIKKDQLYFLVMFALITGVIGSRIFYIVRYFQVFSDHPVDLVSLNPKLFDPWGGLVCGVLAFWIYITRKKMPLLNTLDIASIGLSFFAITLSMADLASGRSFGSPSHVPWAIELWGARRHPTQVYAALLSLFFFIILWWSIARGKINQPGMIFLIFTALSAGSRLLVETFRGDSALLPGGIRSPQVLAWLFLAVSLWLMGCIIKKEDIRCHS
jgi:phosphatidylglycerol:prolipoprotein diacylglycerol transferase